MIIALLTESFSLRRPHVHIIYFAHHSCLHCFLGILCLRGEPMVKLRILNILEEQGHTKYWLYKQLDLSYQNFNRLVTNQTTSIRFDNLDKISSILNCSVGELFEKIPDTEE